MDTAPDDRAALARSYWRRQLILSLVSCAAIVVCWALVTFTWSTTHIRAGSQFKRGPRGDVQLAHAVVPVSHMWPALLALVLTCTVLAIVVVHAARVAAFTFRRGDI